MAPSKATPPGRLEFAAAVEIYLQTHTDTGCKRHEAYDAISREYPRRNPFPSFQAYKRFRNRLRGQLPTPMSPPSEVEIADFAHQWPILALRAAETNGSKRGADLLRLQEQAQMSREARLYLRRNLRKLRQAIRTNDQTAVKVIRHLLESPHADVILRHYLELLDGKA